MKAVFLYEMKEDVFADGWWCVLEYFAAARTGCDGLFSFIGTYNVYRIHGVIAACSLVDYTEALLRSYNNISTSLRSDVICSAQC